MKKEYIDVNTSKLHDELIANGIMPFLVESLEEKTWVTFNHDADMELVQQIIDAHDPTPSPQLPTDRERLQAVEQAILEIVLGGA